MSQIINNFLGEDTCPRMITLPPCQSLITAILKLCLDRILSVVFLKSPYVVKFWWLGDPCSVVQKDCLKLLNFSSPVQEMWLLLLKVCSFRCYRSPQGFLPVLVCWLKQEGLWDMRFLDNAECSSAWVHVLEMFSQHEQSAIAAKWCTGFTLGFCKRAICPAEKIPN